MARADITLAVVVGAASEGLWERIIIIEARTAMHDPLTALEFPSLPGITSVP